MSTDEFYELSRNKKMARLHEKLQEVSTHVKPDPPHLVELAYNDVVYRLTLVGRLFQKADRFSLGAGV